MTPAKLKATRKKRGMTQAELGALLGISEREIRRYEAADVPIPPLVEKFLLMYVNHRQSCDDQ